mmetsp:Transcript_8195/g.16061  ORF Transcript_8195/g.16061 Transcript_8195/m.16061 type:complete len:168 (+) Transcript_8195:359-862(+)
MLPVTLGVVTTTAVQMATYLHSVAPRAYTFSVSLLASPLGYAPQGVWRDAAAGGGYMGCGDAGRPEGCQSSDFSDTRMVMLPDWLMVSVLAIIVLVAVLHDDPAILPWLEDPVSSLMTCINMHGGAPLSCLVCRREARRKSRKSVHGGSPKSVRWADPVRPTWGWAA